MPISADELKNLVTDFLWAEGETRPSTFDAQSLTLKVGDGDGAVMHFVHLAAALEELDGLDPIAQRRVLERRLLALRNPPSSPTAATLSRRLLPRLRPTPHFVAMALKRKVFERVDKTAAPDVSLAHRAVNAELSAQLVFELSEESTDVSDERLSAWKLGFDPLFEAAVKNLAERSTEPFHLVSEGLWASPYSDGHDAARLLVPGFVERAQVHGEPVVMIPHLSALLVAGADDEAALVEMARIALDVSQKPAGLFGVAFKRDGSGTWQPWLPAPERASYTPLVAARLPGVARAYGAQKELLEAWYELEAKPVTVAPLLAFQNEHGDLYSSTVFVKGSTSLLARADRIAFVRATKPGAEEPEVTSLPWAVAAALPGVTLQQTQDVPERWLGTGFPPDEALDAAAAADSAP